MERPGTLGRLFLDLEATTSDLQNLVVLFRLEPTVINGKWTDPRNPNYSVFLIVFKVRH